MRSPLSAFLPSLLARPLVHSFAPLLSSSLPPCSTISLTSLSAFFLNVTYTGEPAYLGSNAFRVQFSVISQPLGGTATLSAPATLPICEPPPFVTTRLLLPTHATADR